MNNSEYFLHKTNSFYDDYDEENEILGDGVNGKVVKCIHKETNTKYALKKLDDCVRARREIDLHWRASRGCRHIVQIKDVYANIVTDDNGKKSHKLFLVTELMNGGELFYKIVKKLKDGLFTERDVAKMMFEIGSAVQHLHTMSIVHRDLKPENLLLTSNDDDAIIKICDFGFAKEINRGLQTPIFTSYYVAPEVLKSQLLGANTYNSSCDIWSLGVIMYILICGRPPFLVSTLPQTNMSEGMKNRIINGNYNLRGNIWDNVSNEAKSLVEKMLTTNPESRIKIDKIMKHDWIQRYNEVPPTPLATEDRLLNFQNQIPFYNQTMTLHLNELRINADFNFTLRPENQIANKLFERRKKKNEKRKNN